MPAADLHALVDIGSNGIRFSITDLSAPLTRTLPTVFLDRAGISIYDALHSSSNPSPGTIPPSTLTSTLAALHRFKHVCSTFSVPPAQVRVVATEATRTAKNSAEFRDAVREATGWAVELLSKEDEGAVGAYGVASSLDEVQGLVMDLGGGSTQLSWLVSPRGSGEIRMARQPVSMPYGAAALTGRLAEATGTKELAALRDEVAGRIRAAFAGLDLPPELQGRASNGGLALYLSGGGFRGFGYLLLAASPIQPYPIPIINGFACAGSLFRQLAASEMAPADVQTKFRISARRAKQLPAVAFLVETLAATLPAISAVRFCQGGVREGCFYATLPPAVRAQDPLQVATAPHAPPSAPEVAALLSSALPPSAPEYMRRIPRPLANMLRLGAEAPKESRSAIALHATTTGALAGVHGLTHEARALLALTLCARWGAELAEQHASGLKARLEDVVGDEAAYWARYLGAVAGVAGRIYPAGVVDAERVRFEGKDAGKGVMLVVRLRAGDVVTGDEETLEEVEEVAKVGKKKRCRKGYRRKVEVVVERDL